MHVASFKKAALLIALVGGTTSAQAKQWEVQMVNKGPSGAMSFEPAYLRIAPRDSVVFKPVNPGHNAEGIKSMTPPSATPFKTQFNKESEVRFDVAGVYGYKCLPHLYMGMVGVIQVGPAGDTAALTAAAAALPPLAKARMLAALAKVK